MKRSSQVWTWAGILVGIGVIVGAVFGATKTDKGRELTDKAGKKASQGIKQTQEAGGRLGDFAGDVWHEARHQSRRESNNLAGSFYEFLGRMKAHGQDIDSVHIYMADGSVHEIDPRKLDDAMARHLIGKSHRL